MIRGFNEVASPFIKHPATDTILPVRSDRKSAGYDFHAKESVTILPNESHLFWTDVKAYMQANEVLNLYPRSSIGLKKGLKLKNTVGVIDASYYENPSNDGNIGICLYNFSNSPASIEAGERIAQGVFQPYFVADEEDVLHTDRVGGFGSSNR